MKPDSDIMYNISQGNAESFTEAFDRFYPDLCYFASKIVHDMDESRSLVQQVFVDLWFKRQKLVIEQSLKSYLYTTVRNYALDFLRHRQVEIKYLQDKQTDTVTYDWGLIEEAELNARINSAIDGLPVKCREIFILCRFEELRYNEIAQKLGLSIKTVEMQMGIALKKLRSKLTDKQNIQILIFLIQKNI
jgi:RNA polymerase sigma-70 factor (ECF subfamily)